MPFRIGDSDLSITASVGAALADGSPAAHVWRNAETALVRAKAAGAGQIEMFSASDESAAGGRVEVLGAGTGTGEPEQASAEAASQQSGAA
jgi:predicted signal transduction protein with EAL and GGDEF domain